jgi:hypothetical protein
MDAQREMGSYFFITRDTAAAIADIEPAIAETAAAFPLILLNIPRAS